MSHIERLEGRALLAADTNDQIREAIAAAVGGTRAGAITPASDVDLYKVTVAAGRRVGFDVDRSPGSALDSYLRLFDAAGRQLAANDNANAPGETAVGPKASYLAHTFGAAGTYYVGVSGRGNAAYNATTGAGDAAGSTGGFTLSLTALAPPAPADGNDQLAEAAAVAIGGSAAGTISPATDVDMYKFTARAGQQVGIDVDRPAGGTLDSFLRLFDARGVELDYDNDRRGPGDPSPTTVESYLQYTFERAGTYYVGVSGGAPQDDGFGNALYNPLTGTGDQVGSTGAFILRLTNIPVPPVPIYDRAISGTVFHDADRDGVRDPGEAGVPDRLLFLDYNNDGQPQSADEYEITTDDEGNYRFTYLARSSTQGTQAGYNVVTTPAFGEALTTPVPIRVSVQHGNAAGKNFGLAAKALPAPAPTDADDQTAEATTIHISADFYIPSPPGQPPRPRIYRGHAQGAINPGTDVDLFKFTPPAAGGVFFIGRPIGSPLDSLIRLFDAGGTEIARYDDADSSGLSVPIPSGTFYIGVSANGNAAYDPIGGGGGDQPGGSVGYYTLSLRFTAAAVVSPPDPDDQIAEAAAVAVGGSVAGTITRGPTLSTLLPDVDLYAVTVAAGQTLGFDVDPSLPTTLDSYLRLFDAAGTELAANDNAPAPGEDGSTPATSYLEYAFAEAGTFYIGVSGSINRTYNPVTGLGDVNGSTGGYLLAVLLR